MQCVMLNTNSTWKVEPVRYSGPCLSVCELYIMKGLILVSVPLPTTDCSIVCYCVC